MRETETLRDTPSVATTTAVYSIGAVSRMLAVRAATLRTWEERYQAVIPKRSGGGHRLFSVEQIDHLRFVVDNIERGMSVSDAHRLLAARLADAQAVTQRNPREIRLSILLAERDLFSADFADHYLRTEGYDTTIVDSVDDAEAAVDAESPSLAVVELLLSGGRGLDLCRTLSERRRLPVIAISTLEWHDEAAQVGATAFLQKPIEPLRLVSTVKQLIGG